MSTARGMQPSTRRGIPQRVLRVAASSLFAGAVLWLSAGAAAAYNNPHGPYNTASDQCATCHRTHADQHESFVTMTPTSHSVDCLVCHDGTGATANVSSEYAAGGVGVNNASTRSYYTHDALAVNTGHRAAASDVDGNSIATNEFAGVSNRHSDCVDCHNPHAASVLPRPVQQFVVGASKGWLISGDLQAVSVVSVGAGSTTFVPGATTSANFEYELCVKCHSNFTVLGTNNPSFPSRDWLNKAAEINPATAGNNSMHPIMAMGTNHTETMTANLAGTSAYKRWTFTDTQTVRCTNCHADGAVGTSADESLPPHASANRGILILPYQDRVLLPSTATANLGNFALCFACHSDVPFKSGTSSQLTAFRRHYGHFASYKGSGGTGTGSIDTPGEGNGFALCAECHFRLHSTINKVGTQNVTGSRLVNFAPNVTANGGTLRWTPRNGTTQGTCVLTCHGFAHNETY